MGFKANVLFCLALGFGAAKGCEYIAKDLTGTKDNDVPPTPEQEYQESRGTGERVRAKQDGFLDGYLGTDSRQSEENNGSGGLENRCFVINGVEHGNCP